MSHSSTGLGRAKDDWIKTHFGIDMAGIGQASSGQPTAGLPAATPPSGQNLAMTQGPGSEPLGTLPAPSSTVAAVPPPDPVTPPNVTPAAAPNYASLLMVNGTAPTPAAGDGKTRGSGGAGLGIGVGKNGGGNEQYFIGVRGTASGTPATGGGVTAERIFSKDPVVGRSKRTTTLAVTSAPVLKNQASTDPTQTVALKGKVTATAVAANFRATGVDVNLRGANGTVSGSIGSSPAVNVSASAGYLQVDNRKKPFGKDAKLQRDGLNVRRVGPPGNRPLPGLDKDEATIYTSAVGVSASQASSGSEVPGAGQATATLTFPVDEKRVPAWVKSWVHRVEQAQRNKDPRVIQQLVLDIQVSPELMARLRQWEEGELASIVAAHKPDPNLLEQAAAAVAGFTAGWSLGGAVEGLTGTLGGLLEFFKALDPGPA